MADKKVISGEEYQAMSRKTTQSGRQVSLPVQTIVGVIIVVILCVLSFFGGESYGKNHAKTTTSPATAFGGQRGGGGFRNGGGFGQVTALSSTSITVQNTRTGTSTTYTITSSTTITDNGQAVSTSDIQTGDTVVVRVASSGSTTATSILVNPSFGGAGGGGGAAGGSATQ